MENMTVSAGLHCFHNAGSETQTNAQIQKPGPRSTCVALSLKRAHSVICRTAVPEQSLLNNQKSVNANLLACKLEKQ